VGTEDGVGEVEALEVRAMTLTVEALGVKPDDPQSKVDEALEVMNPADVSRRSRGEGPRGSEEVNGST